jgi:hypothetical protein
MQPNWRESVQQYRFPALSAAVQTEAARVADMREPGNPLRLSASGYCGRRLAYQRLNYLTPAGQAKPYEAETLNPRALMTFHLGDMVETSLKKWILDAGSLFIALEPPRDVVAIKVGETEIAGHPDGLYQEQDGTYSLVSIKSINTRGYERVELEGPPYEAVCQETAYMAALGIYKARFLYYNKNTSHIADDWMVDFSPTLHAEIVKRWEGVLSATPPSLPEPEYQAEPETEWVRGLKGKMSPGNPTDADGKHITEVKANGYWRETGRKVLPWQCGYCPFKKPCYGESLQPVDLESDKPVWVVAA